MFLAADTTTCDGNEPTGAHLTVEADACDGTSTDGNCSLFNCSQGYAGGSLTCIADGTWIVDDCLGAFY